MRNPPIPITDQTGLEVTVRIVFPLGTFYGRLGQSGFCPVIDMDPLVIQLGTSATSTRITLDNTDRYGARPENLWRDDNPPEGAAVYVEVETGGMGYRVFTGIVQRISEWTRDKVVLDCMDSSAIYRKDLGTTLNKDDWTNLPESNIGRLEPWIWGTIASYKPVLVDEDQVTELTASVISTDMTIHVEDTSDFPSSGNIRINDEVMTYTSTTDTTFVISVRGANDAYGDPTVASSHVIGNQVMEVGPLKFMVSHHGLSGGAITEVRYLGRDDIEILADPSDYTLDLTGPSYITFDQAPVFQEPTTTHKLKIVDYEADVSSTCTNPTYAAGGHSDWDEYNYATIDDGEILELSRSSDVEEPGGELIRMWAVVEYAKTFDAASGSTGDVYFDGTKIGELPDKSNTPDNVKSDQTIWLMSAGFEDSHTHQMPDGEHQHDMDGSGSYYFHPSIDGGDGTTSVWGTFSDCYDGNIDTYDTVHLSAGYTPMQFKFMYTPEGVNVVKNIQRIRMRMRLRKATGSGMNNIRVRFIFPGDQSTTSWQYTLQDWISVNDLASSPDWTDIDSGWVLLGDAYPTYYFLSSDLSNSYFAVEKQNGTSVDLDIADMSIDLLLAPKTASGDDKTFLYNYEPCGTSTPAYYAKTMDLDWLTYTTNVPLETKWYWTAVSQPDSKIMYIVPAIAGEAQEVTAEWALHIKDVDGGGSDFSGSFKGENFGSTVSRGQFDLSGYDLKGSDLLHNASWLKMQTVSGAAAKDIIEVGIWIYYEDSYTVLTGKMDVGDTDNQEGSYSSLAWFDLSSADGWQYPIGKNLKVICNGVSGDEIKVLRLFCVGEYAPMEKKMASSIVCDLTGRTGTFEQVLTDVLTDSNLLGVPSSSVEIPTISTVAAGAIQDPGDGWSLVNRLLDEAGCHGYWSFDGIFKVRLRPSQRNLAGGDMPLNQVISISRSRKDLDDLVNKIETKYNWSFVDETMADSTTRETTASQTKYGKTGDMGLDLQFHRTESAAQTITDTIKSYLDELFQDLKITVGVEGLNLEPADLVRVDADDISADKVEIKEVRIVGLTGNDVKVEIRGTCYDI